MTYSTPIVKAGFLSRPNRFIALVELDGETVMVHVKNTGRCKELLPAGATVYLAAAENRAKAQRKTPYDLVAVEKVKPDGTALFINMDSQAPNAIAAEYLPVSGLFGEDATYRREITHGASRFDFAIDTPDRPTAYLEVKGCTLEREGIAYFPDAPTERGVKHIKELTAFAKAGHPAYILFVTQMKGVTELRPNDETHPAFGEALREAKDAGVQVIAVDCVVETTPNPDGTLTLSVTADQSIPVIL
ncbi:MAG: DNA/RNA nuclease SfsA [Clostridia bacterium]|nr:DNA/RNA nuclease SfsA [Clostridia bacterium]